MKRFLILLALTALLLTSCAGNAALQYEDCFDELDISGRFNELAYDVMRGKTDARLYRKAEVIIEDLESIAPTEDTALAKINRDFIEVAALLVQAMEHNRADDPRAYADSYRAAKELYNETDRILNHYKRTNWENDDR